MAVQPQPDITSILKEIQEGNDDAINKLYEVVYDELRKVAARHMKDERPGHILQTTALVNEAYFRLNRETFNRAENRRYFFGAVSRAMRRILIEYSYKRPSGQMSTNGGLIDKPDSYERKNINARDLEAALKELERLNERQARVVELRFLTGLPVKEVANQLKVSVGTIENDLRITRAWLRDKLK